MPRSFAPSPRLEVALLAGLLLASAFAGCFGAGSQRSGAVRARAALGHVPTTAPQVTLNPDSCALSGSVVDDDDLPLAEAKVELVGYARSTRTALDGSYSFSLLDPATYAVRASKAGYGQVVAPAVVCAAGEESLVPLLSLAALPDLRKPETQYGLSDRGRIGCAVTIQSTTVQAGEGNIPNGLPACGESKTKLAVEPKPGLNVTGAVFELHWTPTTSATGTADMLLLRVPELAPSSKKYLHWATDDVYNETRREVSGSSPLNVTFRLNDTAHRPENVTYFYNFNAGTNASFEVFPPVGANLLQGIYPPGSGPGPVTSVILNQEFTLYVSLFYNDAPVADCVLRGQPC